MQYRLLKRLRPRFNGEIVLGGPQITYQKPDALLVEYPDADVFVRGAGEQALVELAQGNTGEIAGVIRRNGMASSSSFSKVVLKDLPSPLLTPDVLSASQCAPMVRWETARGCAYQCSFCAHDTAPGMRVVDRISTSRLKSEAQLLARAPVRRLNILDPLFNANRGHVENVVDALEDAGFSGEVTAQMHFGAILPKHRSFWMDQLGRLDFDLEFGLQTGTVEVAKECGRKLDRRNVENVVNALRRHNIRFMSTLIYGLPYQTLESFVSTLKWCRQIGIERVRAYPLSLLVGTQFHARQKELGLREGCADEMGEVPIVVETPWMSAEEMKIASSMVC
ncbi:MAG: radical SAM protein [Deltaproteobacteria bacterium]|nr:radical SAM protein [Deltaproteobacteria bacterium]